MIPDYEKNSFTFTELLARRCPKAADALNALKTTGEQKLANCSDIWCRDFMPIQVQEDLFVQFLYLPSYLVDDEPSNDEHEQMRKWEYADYRDMITPPGVAYPDWLKEVTRLVPLVLDGGSIIGNKQFAFVSERVFEDNPEWDKKELRRLLENELDVERIEFVPEHPDDFTGHLDGSIRIVSDKIAVIGRPPPNPGTRDRAEIAAYNCAMHYSDKLATIAGRCGFEVKNLVDVSYRAPTKPRDNIKGLYANFLQIEQKFFVPQWGIEEDAEAERNLRAWGFKLEVVMIPAHEFEIEGNPLDSGGAINCVTWNWKSRGAT